MEAPSGILILGDTFVDVTAGPLASLPTWGGNTISPSRIAAFPGGAALNVASVQRSESRAHILPSCTHLRRESSAQPPELHSLVATTDAKY